MASQDPNDIAQVDFNDLSEEQQQAVIHGLDKIEFVRKMTKDEKFEVIDEVFKKHFPNIDLVKKELDGGYIVTGPFPTIVMSLNVGESPDIYLVSLNSDSALMAKVAYELALAAPWLKPGGPFVELLNGEGIVIRGEEMIEVYEQHIMAQSVLIAKKHGIAVTPEKQDKRVIAPEKPKLIIPGR